MRVRKGVKTALADETKSAEYKKALSENPDIRYERAKHGSWVDAAESSTDDELRSMIDDAASNDEKAIYLRTLSNRELSKGNNDEAQRLFVESAKMATPAGQMLRAMGVVRTAFGDLADAEAVVEKAGKQLTKEQKDKILDLASKDIAAKEKLNSATKAAREDYNKTTLAAWEKARLESGEANRLLTEYTEAIKPRDFADMAVKMIQGNLLTPISITSNVVGNMIFGPLQRTAMSASSILDAMIAGTAKAHASVTGGSGRMAGRAIEATNPLPSLREVQAAFAGLKTAAKEIVSGPSAESYAKIEVQNGFRPLRSWMDFINGENLPIDENGNIARWDRAKAFIEATLGVPPETMFRMLAVGDKPFRRAAEMRALLEQAKLKGIPEKDLEKFINFPDPKTQKIVEQAARRSVFAEENAGIKTINRFLDSDFAKLLRVDKIPVLNGFMKVAGRLTVPFRQFPVNYALTAMNFAAPPLAISKAAYYAFKMREVLADKSLTSAQQVASAMGYRRKMAENMGEAAMGAMMYGAASILWDNGLISESSADTSAKRSDQSERMGAAKLNISGLDRYMNGEDPSYQKGDKLIEWTRLGIPAVIFHIYTDQAVREREKAGKLGVDAKEYSAINARGMLGAAPGLASFVFDQSFLTGTASLFEALKDADPDAPAFKNWVQNMFRATTAMAVPNTVEAVARTQFDYIPELRGESMTDTLANIWKFKTLQMSEDDKDIIYKRDTWGRKLPRTPEGANKYAYHLADVSKMGSQKADPYDQALLDLVLETNRDSVYPDQVGRTFTMPNGSTVELAPDYFEKLQESVGTARRTAMERFVGSRMYQRLDPYERVVALESIYESANRSARQRFLSETNLMQDVLSETPANKIVSRSTKGVLIDEATKD